MFKHWWYGLVVSDSCDPTDCSTPGFSAHRIPQARILEWVAIPFSRGSFPPWNQIWSPALQADSSPTAMRDSGVQILNKHK